MLLIFKEKFYALGFFLPIRIVNSSWAEKAIAFS